MELIVERAGQTTDSAASNMRGLSANPTPPSYHQHCPFRQLGKLIVSSSSGSMAIHLITDATSLRLGHCLISSSFQKLKDFWWERVLSFNGLSFFSYQKMPFIHMFHLLSSFLMEAKVELMARHLLKDPERNPPMVDV